MYGVWCLSCERYKRYRRLLYFELGLRQLGSRPKLCIPRCAAHSIPGMRAHDSPSYDHEKIPYNPVLLMGRRLLFSSTDGA